MVDASLSCRELQLWPLKTATDLACTAMCNFRKLMLLLDTTVQTAGVATEASQLATSKYKSREQEYLREAGDINSHRPLEDN